VGFIDERKVAAFWDGARRAADPNLQTGYLQDEWPAALGAARFRGEWRDVSRWLDAASAGRGACLDVGCGVGVWLEAFSRGFERVHGIDLSAEMVASVKARLAARGIENATVEAKSVLELDDSARYDVVFVGGVLMYLNDDVVEVMVARLAALLRPGGLLILRESTSSPKPWYRDTPLSPGLFAARGAGAPPRPAYHAIYRLPTAYREMAERQGLAILRCHPNRHYKLADMSETWLRVVDKLTVGTLARRPGLAERAARTIHALRALTLLPQYHLVRTVWPRLWKIDNWWTVCRRPGGGALPPGPA
jgi:SAM-dependent methyltransferase